MLDTVEEEVVLCPCGAPAEFHCEVAEGLDLVFCSVCWERLERGEPVRFEGVFTPPADVD